MDLGPLPKMEWTFCTTCKQSYLTNSHHVCQPRYVVWLDDIEFGDKEKTRMDIYTDQSPQQAAIHYARIWDAAHHHSMAEREAWVMVRVEHSGTSRVDLIKVCGEMEAVYTASRVKQEEKEAIDK